MIDLHRLADYETNKLRTMDAPEIFRFFCLKLLDGYNEEVLFDAQ